MKSNILRWKIHYLWLKAQGISTHGIVTEQWRTDTSIIRSHSWVIIAFRFVYLAAIMFWRLLPGLWILARHGQFIFRLWWQWTDFDDKPLPSWPEIKRKALRGLE